MWAHSFKIEKSNILAGFVHVIVRLFCFVVMLCSYLLPDTKNKQKTPTLSRNNSPTWNHTLVFEGSIESVGELASRSLEVTAWDFDKRGSNDFLGGLLLGLSDKASADEKQHWQDLIAAPVGQWVEKRHFLQMNQRR